MVGARKRTLKLTLSTRTSKKRKLVVKEEYESEADTIRTRKNRKLSYCGKEIVNSEEVRQKNRVAAAKSRKRRKLQKEQTEEQMKDLKTTNERLTKTVGILTLQCEEKMEQNKTLRKELSEVKDQQEKMRKELEELKSAIKRTKENSPPVNKSAVFMCPMQRALEDMSYLMLFLVLANFETLIYLQILLHNLFPTNSQTLMKALAKNPSSLPYLIQLIQRSVALGIQNGRVVVHSRYHQPIYLPTSNEIIQEASGMLMFEGYTPWCASAEDWWERMLAF